MQVDVSASLGDGQQTLQDEALSLKLFQGVELSALEGAKVTQTLHTHKNHTPHGLDCKTLIHPDITIIADWALTANFYPISVRPTGPIFRHFLYHVKKKKKSDIYIYYI